jgi:O-antigen/teichoic acid export membrane protein
MVIITVGLNLLLVMVFEMGITGVLISSVLGPLIIGLTFIPDLIRNITKKVDWKKWKEILKYSAPTVPASLSVIALQFIDQPVITAVLGPEALAVYGTNYKLALPMMMFVTMFEYAWKPFYLNRYKDDNAIEMFKTVLNYYVATCGFIFLVVSGFIPYIVKMRIGDEYFIDPGYWSGIYIIPIIMGGYFFNGLFNQFSMGVNIQKATKYLPIAVGSAALVNLFGNILLLEHYGIDAAAWLTLISYAIAATIIYYFSRKVFPIDYNWKKIFLLVVSVLLIYALSLYLDNYFSGNLKAVPDLIAVVLYPVVLYFTGFFEKKELSYIKRLIKRK